MGRVVVVLLLVAGVRAEVGTGEVTRSDQCCHHQERQFEISKEDHLNIQLAEAVGVRHLAVSYPQVPLHSRYTVWRRLTQH